MDNVRMLFRRDLATGMPRLDVYGACLRSTEIGALEREIKRRFEQLVRQQDGSIVTFQTPVGEYSYPLQCRVFVNENSNSRCPELTFELLTTKQKHTNSVRTVKSWPRQFLGDLQRSFLTSAMTRLNSRDRKALELVIAELRVLALNQAQVLPLILLAGYLALGQQRAACLGNEANRYLLGARAFNTLFACGYPAPAAESQQSSPSRPRIGRLMPSLKSLVSLLERLCGMSDPSL